MSEKEPLPSPDITRDEDHIIFKWPDSPRLYMIKPPFTGNLRDCFIHIKDGERSPLWGQVDLADIAERGRIARDLQPTDEIKRYALRQKLEVVCREAARMIYRQGEPVALTPRKPTISPYLIDPLIVEGAINAVWAPLSHFKGWLALVCTAGLIQGVDPVPGVLRCASGRRPVLYLDWESTADKFEARLYALGVPESAIADGWFRYAAMTASLPTLASTIREYMREQERLTGLEPVLMVDSWAMACGTDRPEGAGATIPAMLALRSLGSTSYILGHTTKKDSDKKGKRKRTFYGSIFNQNLARNNWEIVGITKAEESRGQSLLPLRHAEQHLHFHRANDGRQDNPDIKLIYTFTNERQGEGEVLASVVCRGEAEFEADPKRQRTIADHLLSLYREHGDMTDAEMTLHIPIDDSAESWQRKRRALGSQGELVQKGKKGKEHLWGLPGADGKADEQGGRRADG